MLYWLLALAAVMFGLYNVFIKASSDHINPVLGAVVLQFVAAFLGLGLLLYQRAAGAIALTSSTRGVALAFLAGPRSAWLRSSASTSMVAGCPSRSATR